MKNFPVGSCALVVHPWLNPILKFGCFDFWILLDMFDAFEIWKNNFLLQFPVTVGLLES